MRESIGGAMIFWIVLFLFSIFISFIAFIIKYARVYKIKNTVVNYIIRNDGAVSHSEIDQKLKEMSYKYDGRYKICRYFPSDLGEYYYIELYSDIEFPIIGTLPFLTAIVSGETKIMSRDEQNTNLQSSGITESSWFYGTEDQCFYCDFGQRTFSENGSKCDRVDVE